MKQPITGFHTDSENHWVAELQCGHRQHVRHDPPWMERPWVLTDEGRKSRLGVELNCKRCDEIGSRVAKAVLEACRHQVAIAYEDAGLSGLCSEGRIEVALDSLSKIDLGPLLEKALRESDDSK